MRLREGDFIRLFHFIFSVNLIVSGAVYAQTIEEREAWAAQMDYLKPRLHPANETCHTTFKFEFDKAWWWKVKERWGAGTPKGRCSDVVDRLSTVCRPSTKSQKAVAAGVKSIRCGYGGTKSGFKFSVTGGLADYWVEIDRPNVEEETHGIIKKSL